MIFSQTLKQFQGSYENGTATYQYYENDKYERIYQGTFKYKGIVIDGLKGKLNLTVTGQYNKDRKDGEWVYVLSDPALTGVTETITGSYVDGSMEGVWTSSAKANKTKKVFKSTSAFFKNNRIAGELSYDYTAYTFKDYAAISTKGILNDSGLFDGTWVTTYTQANIQYEETRKYKNGVLYWLLYRRLSDGAILEKFDSTIFVNQFFQNYDPSKKISVIGKDKYVLKETIDKYSGSLIIPITVLNYWTHYNKDAYYNTLTAPNPAFVIDHGYTKSKGSYERVIINWRTTIEGEKQAWQDEQENKAREAKYDELILKADSAFKMKLFDEAISIYNSALLIIDLPYPKTQILKAQLNIDEVRIAREQEQKAKEASYNDLIAKADAAMNDKKYDVASELYQSALSIKNEDYPKQQLSAIKQLINEEARNKVLHELEKLWVNVESGTYKMGCLRNDMSCLKNEEPVHQVMVNAFQISKYEISVGQYKAFCKVKNIPEPQGADNLPVTNVSWKEAVDFAEWLGCRLPTEAEWEFAARGGIKNKKWLYSGSNELEDVAWYSDNAANTVHPVGKKMPNTLGLYDMTGNVWEWCSDWYAEYTENDQVNPQGPLTGSRHVKRGGSFNENNFEIDLRITNRSSEPGNTKLYNLGFRLVKK